MFRFRRDECARTFEYLSAQMEGAKKCVQYFTKISASTKPLDGSSRNFLYNALTRDRLVKWIVFDRSFMNATYVYYLAYVITHSLPH